MADAKKRILLVDDDVALGNVLQQALKFASEVYDVRLARDADEALAQVSRREFDLIVTDVQMEGLSGLQLLRALRRVAPETRTVVMTAFSTDEIKDRAEALGVYGYLTKPFNLQQFRALVSTALAAEGPPRTEKLHPSQLEAVNQTLADLRANTGARAVFFTQEDSANVLGAASAANDLDLTSLAQTMVEITHRQVAEVARVFGGGSGFQRSQYVGETFNLATYCLAGEGLLTLVYSHQVKEGIISFYARQALERLAEILGAQVPPESLTGARSESQTSPEAATFAPESAPPLEERATSEPLSLEQAMEMGLLDDAFLDELEKE